MKSIATDIYTFERLRKESFIYVDKTKCIYDLVNKSRGFQFFLSRPRRFGKSLLLSTLQAIFEGKREHFDGLFIDSTDYDWKTYPVIRLDMNTTLADTVEETENSVKFLLECIYQENNLEYNWLFHFSSGIYSFWNF